jgi:uncharacterized protein (DUF305 family)
MYAMVDAFANVFASVNQLYMAALMTAPMVVVELVVMRDMYHARKLNVIVMMSALTVGILMWVGIRQQIAVGDRQFLRSMIPHHAGALLMCNRASVTDAEIRELCRTILEGQEREIVQMKAILTRLRAGS